MAARIFDTLDAKGDELALYVSTDVGDADPFFVSATFNDEAAVYLNRDAAEVMHKALGRHLQERPA